MEYPRRKPLRLKGYDYSQSGAYFLTICVGGRRAVLSDICGGEVLLRPAGTIVEAELLRLQNRYSVAIGKYVIMPDHIHMIMHVHRQTIRTRTEDAVLCPMRPERNPPATDRGGPPPRPTPPRPMREEQDEAPPEAGAEQSPAPTVGDILCAFKQPDRMVGTGPRPMQGEPDDRPQPSRRGGTLPRPMPPETMEAPPEQSSRRGVALPRPTREEWNEVSPETWMEAPPEAGAEQSPAPTVGDILCAFKSITTKEINRYCNTPGQKLWQRSYYEHIIRNEREYLNLWRYIEDNPRIWEQRLLI